MLRHSGELWAGSIQLGEYFKSNLFPENTCDQTGMLDIPYGQGKSLMRGAVYK